MKKLLGLFAAAMLCASFASAANDAGCGLGSLLFKENRMSDQILAATTNGTSGNQTFGITSGTLNCNAEGNLGLGSQSDFMAANFRDLSREMSIGSGEHLTSLAGLLGCSKDSVTEFGALTQKNYGVLFPTQTATPEQVLGTLKAELRKDAKLSTSCTML